MNALARELKEAIRPAGDRVSDALDAALEMTFAASDPVAVYIPRRIPVHVLQAATPRRRGEL